MPLLTVANIGHSYGTRTILNGATMSIEPSEKIGLVGRNGSGKTTLLKAILGQITPDSGQIQFAKNARVGYLSQDPKLDPTYTLRDAAEAAFEELHRLYEQQHELFEAMATAGGDELERLLKKQTEIEAGIEAAGGYAIDHRIDATLHGLGFTDDQFGLPVTALSGGQKGRLGLARLLLEAPDLLLLDEPTNHLDIAGREWLEDFLADEYAGAVLVVSHDRWLLDRVVNRIVEVEQGVIREYPGNYHKFIELRKERKLTEQRVYDKQRDRIRSEETFIAKYKAGQRAKQARGRQSRLERFKRDELVERPVELDTMRLNLPKVERSGDLVVVAENMAKRYGDLTLFENLTFTIERGERIGILGPNGAGKTTLVKCMLGEIEPDEGSVRLGSRVSVGHYQQTHDHLDLSLTVWQYLQSVIVGPDGEAKASEQQARDLAGAFLFSGMDQDKLLADISGGERGRAVLAGLVGSSHNVLVLDEPTNHLDIPSAERLEQTLSRDGGYQGTLLLISHDRALLESTCDRLLVLGDSGQVSEFLGNYSQWVAMRQQQVNKQREQASQQAAKQKKKQQAATSRKQKQQSSASSNGLAKLSMRKLEEKIEQLDSRVKEIDSLMLDEEVYTDGKRCKALQDERAELAEQLEPLEFEWSRRAEDDE